jgi:hypothetical protein
VGLGAAAGTEDEASAARRRADGAPQRRRVLALRTLTESWPWPKTLRARRKPHPAPRPPNPDPQPYPTMRMSRIICVDLMWSSHRPLSSFRNDSPCGSGGGGGAGGGGHAPREALVCALLGALCHTPKAFPHSWFQAACRCCPQAPLWMPLAARPPRPLPPQPPQLTEQAQAHLRRLNARRHGLQLPSQRRRHAVVQAVTILVQYHVVRIAARQREM